jgi:predicted metal-dependent peptidase
MLDLNDPIVSELVKARVKLLLGKPWFGTLATRLELVDASTWCQTAATDGRHFFYNREFIKSLTLPELLFLVGHEVLHVVYDHLGRRNGRDPKLWNMAADYIINYTLKQEAVGTMPAQGLYDPKYTDEMTAEEVYELLKKNSVTIKMPLDQHLQLGDDDDDQDGEGKGQGQDSVDVTVTGKDGPPKLTEEDLQRIRSEIRSAAIQAAQQVGAGKVPAGVRRMIEALTQPKLDWRTLLDSHVRSSVKDDYTFQRISRRAWDTGMLFPSQDNLETVKLWCAIDASGSMSEEMLRDLLSEVKGIMQTFPDFEIGIMTFDTQIYNVQTFTPSNIHEIEEYPLAGGGGTMFECCWEYFKKEGIIPERFVMFTDGYPGGSWGDEQYCSTLFVIHGTTTIEAPFGVTAYYEEPSKLRSGA